MSESAKSVLYLGLAKVTGSGPIAASPIGSKELVEAWLRARSPNTLRAYQHDLMDFSRFLGVPSLDAAAAQLLGSGHGRANMIALGYKSDMMQRNLSGATICRRLSALRSLVKLARMLDMANWALEVENVDSEPYRDTAGPTPEGVQALIDVIHRRGGPFWLRDQLIVSLLFDLALRRGEVARLDIADVDLKTDVLWVVRKRKRERVKVAFAEPTKEAILDWLQVRGRKPGPLVQSARGGRLSGKGVWDVLKKAARAARIEAKPHALRHASITSALDEGCDLRSVSRFAGHDSPVVTQLYDDRRRDLSREVAAKVASLVRRHRSSPPETSDHGQTPRTP